MKIFNRHFYITDSNGIPLGHNQASNAGGPAAPTGTAAPETETAEPNRDANAQRPLFGTRKFLMVTREKYRPPQSQGQPHAQSTEQLPAEAVFQRQHADKNVQTEPASQLRAGAQQAQLTGAQPGFQKFTELPLDVQVLIASMMLPEDRKRFRFAAKHTYQLGAMASPHLKINSPDLLKEALRKYHAGGIKSLTLSGPFQDIYLRNRELQGLMHGKLGSLEYFDISECKDLSAQGVMEATRHFPNLRQLNLSGPEEGRELSQMFLYLVLEGLPELRHLDLSNIRNLTPALLDTLQHVPRLEYLGMSRSRGLNDAGLTAALQHMPHLTHLDVSRTQGLTQAGLAAALQHVPHLTHLNVSGMAGLTEDGLTAVLQHVPHLTHLDMSDMAGATRAGFTAVLQCVRNLTHLSVADVPGLTEDGLVDGLQHVPNLRHLDISGIADLTDAGLTQALGRVGRLEHLNMSGMVELTDERLASALEQVPHLKKLDISQSAGLENIQLPALASLENLNVSECRNLEQINLSRLPALKHLNLGSAQIFDTAALDQTLQAVKNTLVYLNLSHLPQLDDEHLPDFSSFKELRYLDLSWNEKISDAALRTLPASLHHLFVTACSGLTDDGVRNLPRTINVTEY